ncbi:MAG TPA: fluoride efflux transporter CrcB, partial [Polyangiaceae bacterium]|nr:fluoride efflux transporter CrcB [Polyangiaceae bacterium]
MNSWREWLWIALAGAFGACARVGLSLFVHQHFGNALAWGTMSVNVLGSFAFGVIVQIGLSSNWLPDELRLALT